MRRKRYLKLQLHKFVSCFCLHASTCWGISSITCILFVCLEEKGVVTTDEDEAAALEASGIQRGSGVSWPRGGGASTSGGVSQSRGGASQRGSGVSQPRGEEASTSGVFQPRKGASQRGSGVRRPYCRKKEQSPLMKMRWRLWRLLVSKAARLG